MVRLTDYIIHFHTLEELCNYSYGKYGDLTALSIPNGVDKIYDRYTSNNSYNSYAFRLTTDDIYKIKVAENLYCITFINKSFNSTSKGKLIGALNKKRINQTQLISEIDIGDGFISFYLNSNSFHSFEVGLIVDEDYNNRDNAFYELMKAEENFGN